MNIYGKCNLLKGLAIDRKWFDPSESLDDKIIVYFDRINSVGLKIRFDQTLYYKSYPPQNYYDLVKVEFWIIEVIRKKLPQLENTMIELCYNDSTPPKVVLI